MDPIWKGGKRNGGGIEGPMVLNQLHLQRIMKSFGRVGLDVTRDRR